MGTLLLFTIGYPLTPGEVFLHGEIKYLSECFERVLIFPMNYNSSGNVKEIPVNVEIVKFNIFQPYNRVNVLLHNFALIVEIYINEFLFSRTGFKHIRYFKKTFNDLTHKIAMSKRLESILLSKGVHDATLYTYWFTQWTFILSFIKLKHPHYKLYTRIHGMDVYEEQHEERGFFYMFRKFQTKHISKIMAISQNGMNHFLEANGSQRDKIGVYRLGVEDNGINTNKHLPFFRLVSCSALQKYKRIHLIVEILKNTVSSIEWIHFGDGELKKEILKRIEELPQNINFIWKGYAVNHEVISFYRNNKVDLFINTSSTEGIPVSIMEAISFGIPVIATNVGGVAEIVNKETGYLIEKDFNPSDVAKLIEFFFAQKNKETIRITCRNFWQDNFNAKTNYNKLCKTLMQ